jgi:hypothetical protein
LFQNGKNTLSYNDTKRIDTLIVLAIGVWLLVFGYWCLAIGVWLLVFGYWFCASKYTF